MLLKSEFEASCQLLYQLHASYSCSRHFQRYALKTKILHLLLSDKAEVSMGNEIGETKEPASQSCEN